MTRKQGRKTSIKEKDDKKRKSRKRKIQQVCFPDGFLVLSKPCSNAETNNSTRKETDWFVFSSPYYLSSPMNLVCFVCIVLCLFVRWTAKIRKDSIDSHQFILLFLSFFPSRSCRSAFSFSLCSLDSLRRQFASTTDWAIPSAS